MSNNNIRMTRRQLLQQAGIGAALGVAGHPLAILIESIFNGAMQSAHAQSLSYVPRNYLMIQFPGANPRWNFDLPFAPYGGKAKIQFSGYIGTKFVAKNGVYADLEHALVSVKAPDGTILDMPWVWQYSVPKVGGGERPMTDLLQNMLVIRGIDVGNPAHFGAQALQFRPGTPMSLGALAADYSTAPIPAINLDCNNYSFVSTHGLSAVPLTSGGNVLTNLLDAFLQSSANNVVGFRTKKNLIDRVISTAVEGMDASARDLHSGMFDVEKANESAQALLKEGFGNLEIEFNTRVAKYTDLISRALSNSKVMAGINDLPIGVAVGSRNADYMFGSSVSTTSDLRGSVGTPRNLATHFAVAEYVMVKGLSGSVAIAPGAANVGGLSMFFDEHSAGRIISALGSIYYARAFAACMLEFIDQLKAANKFNETIIQAQPEFGRKPRAVLADDQGSDHAETAGVVSFYSGSIQTPQISGNIQALGEVKSPGTFGKMASNKTISGATFGVLTYRHLAASIAKMLRAPSPVSSATPSVVQESKGVISSILEKGKII